MIKKETAFLTLLWHDILNRTNATSIQLQKSDAHLGNGINLMKSLGTYIKTLRSGFENYDSKVSSLSSKIEEEYDQCKGSIRKKFPDGKDSSNEFTKQQRFKIETFFVVIDTFWNALDKRITAYNEVYDTFFFLINVFESESGKEELQKSSEKSLKKFIEMYKRDVTEDLKNEFTQFKDFVIINLKNNNFDSNLISLYVWFQKTNLKEVFPLVGVTLRIYLTLPISNCSAERSFSKMARIKSKFRSTMVEENLNASTILSTEFDVTRRMNFNKIIEDFSEAKARKKKSILINNFFPSDLCLFVSFFLPFFCSVFF